MNALTNFIDQGDDTMTTRRDFMKKAGVATAAAGTTAFAAPYVKAQNAKITWRLQTYAGPALGEHVIKPAIDAFNKVANGEMEIELYYADQLVPTGELFRAMKSGTRRMVKSKVLNGFRPVHGIRAILQPLIRSTVWKTLKASASLPSRRQASSCRALALFRLPCRGKTSRLPSRLASLTGLHGRASPRITRSVGPM